MSPFGSVEFEVVELPYELRIRYGHHAGWIERSLAPALVPPLFVIGWFWQRPGVIVAAGALTVLLMFRWAWNHPSELTVLPDRLITSAYLWNRTETALTDIQSLQWLRGEIFAENGDPDGLYVSLAGNCRCVLPLVSQKQGKEATDAIKRRFPKYPVDVPVPGSLRFEVPLDMTAFTLPSPAELDSKKTCSSEGGAEGASHRGLGTTDGR